MYHPALQISCQLLEKPTSNGTFSVSPRRLHGLTYFLDCALWLLITHYTICNTSFKRIFCFLVIAKLLRNSVRGRRFSEGRGYCIVLFLLFPLAIPHLPGICHWGLSFNIYRNMDTPLAEARHVRIEAALNRFRRSVQPRVLDQCRWSSGSCGRLYHVIKNTKYWSWNTKFPSNSAAIINIESFHFHRVFIRVCSSYTRISIFVYFQGRSLCRLFFDFFFLIITSELLQLITLWLFEYRGFPPPFVHAFRPTSQDNKPWHHYLA